MNEEPGEIQHVRTSWALQGCLIGSVVLFVILLITLLFLAYGQFQEHTQPDAGQVSSSSERTEAIAIHG